jgi:hypothetical protein
MNGQIALKKNTWKVKHVICKIAYPLDSYWVLNFSASYHKLCNTSTTNIALSISSFLTYKLQHSVLHWVNELLAEIPWKFWIQPSPLAKLVWIIELHNILGRNCLRNLELGRKWVDVLYVLIILYFKPSPKQWK